MTLVIDSSVAAKWFVEEPGSAEAEALLTGDRAVAPDIIVSEVLNAIWKNIRMGRLAPAQMKLAAAALPRRLSEVFPSHAIAEGACEIAVSLDHPIYDCFYLALAEREGCRLVTADERLYRKTRGTKFAKLVQPLLSR